MFLGFPKAKRLPGPWEWTVSGGLAVFYLFMGWSLLAKISEPLPDAMRYAFLAVLLALAGLSLPLSTLTVATPRSLGETGFLRLWHRAFRCTCWYF